MFKRPVWSLVGLFRKLPLDGATGVFWTVLIFLEVYEEARLE